MAAPDAGVCDSRDRGDAIFQTLGFAISGFERLNQYRDREFAGRASAGGYFASLNMTCPTNSARIHNAEVVIRIPVRELLFKLIALPGRLAFRLAQFCYCSTL